MVVGNTIGPYRVLDKIGEGGMGEVYRAKDTRLDRTVAIKVLPSYAADNPEQRLRLDREAHAIAALNHPHICTLYDIGHQDGIDYLVMEYLDVDTLATRLTRGALPLDQVLRYATEIADALDKAHRAGIVHRDLKPGNEMLTKAGAKLLDFGLAKSTPGLTPWPTPVGFGGPGFQPGPGATDLPTSPASLNAKGIDSRHAAATGPILLIQRSRKGQWRVRQLVIRDDYLDGRVPAASAGDTPGLLVGIEAQQQRLCGRHSRVSARGHGVRQNTATFNRLARYHRGDMVSER